MSSDDVDGWLAELKLAGDLGRGARYDPGCGELLERLDEVDQQPWVALCEALREAA